jgi:hypothetical protein
MYDIYVVCRSQIIVRSLQCMNFSLSLWRLNDPIDVSAIQGEINLQVFYFEKFAVLTCTV